MSAQANIRLEDGMHVAIAGTLQRTNHQGMEERLSAVGIILARPEDADLVLLGARAGKAGEEAESRGIPVVEEAAFLVALEQAEYAAGVELLVGTDGGPVVGLPANVHQHWEGSFQPSDGRVVEADYRFDDPEAPATDYDAAVGAIWGQFGLGSLQFQGVTALVFPQPFCAVRNYTSGDYAEAMTDGGWDTLDAVLAKSGDEVWKDTDIRLEIDESGLVLFDPAYKGVDDYNQLKLQLNAGTWRVDECQARHEGRAVVAARLRKE